MMFCAFEGSPLTLRIHGQAEVIEVDNPEFNILQQAFPDLPAQRAIIRLVAGRIADSCGWSASLCGHKRFYFFHGTGYVA